MSGQDRMPRILFATGHLPCPPQMGAHLRVFNIAKQLRKAGSVTFVYIGKPFDPVRLKATQQELGPVQTFVIPDRPCPSFLKSHRYRFEYHWPWYHSAKLSKTDQATFFELCKSHDLNWFHTLNPADTAGRFSYPDAVIDLDDLNQKKFSLMLQTETQLRGKIGIQFLIYKWRRWEQIALKRFSHKVVCSPADRVFLGNTPDIHVIPNGFEKPEITPVWKSRRQTRVGFIGQVDYMPNRRGLEWFTQTIWPIILKQQPNARLRIAGNMTCKDRFSAVPSCDILGFIPSTEDEFATWSSMIVPLQFGGGTRLKILDAFSKKCPVISTSVGAYGLDITHGRDILIADTAEDFASCCIDLLDQEDFGRKIADEAWQLFEANYTWDAIGKTIQSVVQNATGGIL